MTGIRQLQMSYNAEEDRILLRLNTQAAEEIRFWITRRYGQMLIKALHAHVAKDPDVSSQPTSEAKQAVQSFKQEAAQSAGNFDSEFQQSDSFPLGENPILAHKLSYGIDGGIMQLTMEPKKGQGIKLAINNQLNFNISKLLRSASDAGQWNLDWGTADPASANRIIN